MALNLEILFSEQIIHKVDARDTLFAISLLYNSSIEEIKALNNLQTETIRMGEELIIPLSSETPRDIKEATIYTYQVKRGDTLSQIASELDIDPKKIIQLNKLESDIVKINQHLKIPGKAKPGEVYIVKHGDSLSAISLLFDISKDELFQINDFNDFILQIDEELLVAAPRPQTYIVEKGDSLWNIAKEFKISLDELKDYNQLSSESIRSGISLKLYPYTLDLKKETVTTQINLASLGELPFEEYRNYENERKNQPSMHYAETRLENPLLNYEQATTILEEFNALIAQEKPLSNSLSGYTIVLDPGHGGLDPGAIVSSRNGRDQNVYVVEDEYVYDISLRAYRLLKLHGATVVLTIISPNHLIRKSSNPSETFVNMKNEVYNLKSLNRSEDDSCWPVGGSKGLLKRVKIAENAFENKDPRKTLYLSIHADNSPDHGQGSMILYSSETNETISQSKELAVSLAPYMGASSTTGAQDLAVLRDNPAWAEVLIEVRNLHYPGNSWAIRYDKLREQDAQFITRGIVNYAKMR